MGSTYVLSVLLLSTYIPSPNSGTPIALNLSGLLGDKKEIIMTTGTIKNPIAGNDEIIELAISCLRAGSIEEVIAATARTITAIEGADTLTIALPAEADSYTCYLATPTTIDERAYGTIRKQLAYLLEDISEATIDEGTLAIQRVFCPKDGVTREENRQPRILWSVDIGPIAAPTGVMAIFGQDIEAIDQDALANLRVIGTLVGEAIHRISIGLGEVSPSPDHGARPRIIYFEISHLMAIQEVFGLEQTARLRMDVLRRIGETLPRSTLIAQIGPVGIVAVIQDSSLDIDEITKACIIACKDLEIAEKILVHLEASSATTRMPPQMGTNALLVSRPPEAPAGLPTRHSG